MILNQRTIHGDASDLLWSSCRVSVIFFHFYQNLNVDRFRNINFHENSFSCGRVFPWEQMDRRTDRETQRERERQTDRERETENYTADRKRLAKLIIIFRNLANLPKVVPYSVTLCGDCGAAAFRGWFWVWKHVGCQILAKGPGDVENVHLLICALLETVLPTQGWGDKRSIL